MTAGLRQKYYTGIGSRKTPQNVCKELTLIARKLNEAGYILRSGGAVGADQAFEYGAGDLKEIYRPRDHIPEWAYDEAAKMVPPNRPSFNLMSVPVQRILARNMMQVLGKHGNTPSEFVVCWTPAGVDDGGTGYAMRCAKAHMVDVFNLRNGISHFSRAVIFDL